MYQKGKQVIITEHLCFQPSCDAIEKPLGTGKSSLSIKATQAAERQLC